MHMRTVYLSCTVASSVFRIDTTVSGINPFSLITSVLAYHFKYPPFVKNNINKLKFRV